MHGLLPGVGAAARTVTCLYTLTPDRDFVVGPVPGARAVLVGLGAGHGFKFAPTFGRVLADLVTTGATSTDISAFAPDRPALVEAGLPGELAGVTGALPAQAWRDQAELGGGQRCAPRT